MRITRTHILIAAVITLVLAVICGFTFATPAFDLFMVLAQLSLFGFMSLYITYAVPEKSFRH
jgi:hypothetical protein